MMIKLDAYKLSQKQVSHDFRFVSLFIFLFLSTMTYFRLSLSAEHKKKLNEK